MLSTGDSEWDEIERRLAKGEDPDKVFADWDVEPSVTPVRAPQFEESEDEFADVY